jgi:hypothetical protein
MLCLRVGVSGVHLGLARRLIERLKQSATKLPVALAARNQTQFTREQFNNPR